MAYTHIYILIFENIFLFVSYITITSSVEEIIFIMLLIICLNRLNNLSKVRKVALAGVSQWIEGWPSNQRVAGSIPSLGHMPGLQASSPVGGVPGATTH